MPPKRQSSSSSTTTTTASALGGVTSGDFYPADEFTRTVKKRLATSSRTGQACDRCKVRKIRCDGLPGGCSPCIQNRTECRTTDRISQKAIPRGYVESLEAKCAALEAKNKEMENALMRTGLEGRSNGVNGANGFAPRNMSSDWGTSGGKAGSDGPWNQNRKGFPGPSQGNYQTSAGSCCSSQTPERLCQSIRSASFRPGNTGTHYLGISSGSSYLSSIKASALSLLGIDIDLSDLDPSEPNHPASANDESFSSCLSTIFNVNPNVPKMELPPRDEAFQYVDWFFLISHPYLPILHRPTFIKMLDKMYTDKTYEASPAQIAMVHMVFAIVHFQNATRDRMKNRGHTTPASIEVMQRSRNHYHYALSFFYGLLSHSALEDLQAIGLILQHLRAFPKPGGSWLLSRIAISLCFELGLHRSPKKWVYPGSTQNTIEIELRKRIFWSILTLETSLSARLGRPMSIRAVDYDVEYPERIDDEYITESGFIKRDESVDECSFDVAIEMFKFTTLYIEMLGTLYTPARPSTEKYVSLVQELEAKLDAWRTQAPKSIALDAPKMEKRFQAVHLASWYHECRILMRHPSLSLSPSPSFTSDCITICVESSRQILHLTDELRKGSHYLDTTWSGTTIQLIATLTILFSVWQKRDTVTSDEVIQVKADMDLCMDIMGDVGSLLGSPNRLREVVQLLTHGTMELLNRKKDQNPRSGSTSRGSTNSSYPSYTTSPQYNAAATAPPTMKIPSTAQVAQDQFQPPLYQPPHDNRPPIFNETGVVVSLPGAEFVSTLTHTGPIYNPQPPVFAQSAAPSYPSDDWWSGNESWREYTHSISHMAGELDPTETYSASALITLNRDCNNSIIRPDPPAQHNHVNVSAPGGIVMSTVTTAESPGGVMASRSPFSQNNEPPNGWQMMGNFGFGDNSLSRGGGDGSVP
ncbi:hypothetical protein L873DRAFT_1671301 [Choiromyces venosus 120613-1]|uniref:Zn(2)-C6 fungal-type domain-containing protein n=1 Tax=Choiromyces venosus 120613-1 TaxID=1336337 RepID=A0A3N4KB46_9PEZI|nr:hypothetical protein L873DRAFT_1671301 [Choiromyces venosus 120613-1]